MTIRLAYSSVDDDLLRFYCCDPIEKLERPHRRRSHVANSARPEGRRWCRYVTASYFIEFISFVFIISRPCKLEIASIQSSHSYPTHTHCSDSNISCDCMRMSGEKKMMWKQYSQIITSLRRFFCVFYSNSMSLSMTISRVLWTHQKSRLTIYKWSREICIRSKGVRLA